MNKQSESQLAQNLREREFKIIDKELSLAVRENASKKLSRNERRLLRTAKYRPWFIMTDLMTTATDETGQSWVGPPNTDLSDLGFEDKTEEFKKDIKRRRQSDKKYH